MTFLLTGGSASGKSSFGETLATRLPAPRFLIDAARPDPWDAERLLWRAHMAEAGFTALTCENALGGLCLPSRGTVLLECLCHLCAHEMFDGEGRFCDPFSDILRDMDRLLTQCGHLIVVTNELGSATDDYALGTRRYVEIMGRLNAALAVRFNHVYELVCGVPLVLKGELK